MAVEIPVIIDIDQAFEDAAERVRKAITPLQHYIDSNALKLRLKIDETSTRSLGEILKNASITSGQLNTALADVERKIQKIASTKRGFDMINGLTDREQQLLEAYTILQRRITGIGNTSTATQKIININISRVKREIDELSIKLKNADKGSARFQNLNNKLITARQNLANLNTELAKVRAQDSLAGLEGSLTRADSKLMSLVKNSIRLIALHSATRFIRNVREVTAEFEMQRVALGGIIQDTEKANQLFRQIKAAAIQSPFQIKDLVSYTKQLSAYRVETENLFNVTTKLADVSAGLGVDMGRIILAYGQVRAASVLRGQELRQFTEAGIPLVEELAKKFTELNGRMVSTSEVFELISKRAVPFAMIEDIFNDMTDAGGVFYKMQEKQAETLAGQWSNLKDAVSIMYDEIGNTHAVHSAMEGMISTARSLMTNWRQIGTIIASVVSQFALFKVASMFVKSLSFNVALAEKATLALSKAEMLEATAAGKGNVVKKLQISQLKQYATWTNKAAVAQTVFGRTASKLVASFLGGGWITLALTAVTALVGWFVSARKEANRLNKELEKIGSDGANSINRSVSNFNRLADAAVNAADGSDAQNKALEELKRTYNDIIPEQNLQIEKLKAMKGDYENLTLAIQEKINMQLREQKINAAEDYYANKITKSRKEAKKFLQRYGLDKDQINAVLDEIQKAVNDGMINANQSVAEKGVKFEEIIKNLTGIVVDFGNGYRDYTGEWQAVGDIHEKAKQSLLDVSRVYLELNEEVNDIKTDMSSSIGTMGVYAQAWEDLKKEIDGVTVSEQEFGNKYTFAFKKEKIRKEVEVISHAIEDAFKSTGIDITEALKPEGTINFNYLSEAAKSSSAWGLTGFIKNVQKVYEELVPTNKMVGVIERKFQDVADAVGISMDDVQGYLLRGDKDMEAYAKEISSSLEKARLTVLDYKKRMADFNEHPGVVEPVSDEQMKKATDLVSFLELINDYLSDYLSKKSAATKKQDKTALTFLKEELKNVQEIYKRYKKLIEYMDEESAQSKIKEIYGNVTAIDFLSPEKYKQRIAEILHQIRELQGTVKRYNHELSQEMFDDIKQSIKKNEGLALEAYKLPGEKYYTIGYGFYKNLPDGREVTAGMKLTAEEAEKYLEQYISQYSKTAENLLAQYGEGMQLTERQFNVLVDLAYQGPAALKRALINAKGDINAFAEELKSAASVLVAAPLREAVKGRDMKRYAAFMAGGEMSDDEAKSVAEAIFDAERVVQDVDWDEFKEEIEKSLDKVAKDIKRSETAKNFYKNILDVTGDEELATNMTVSVYGEPGAELGDRIKKEIEETLKALNIPESDPIYEKIMGAASKKDFRELMQNMGDIPKELKDVIEKSASILEKNDTQLLKHFADLIAKYGDTAQKIATIKAKAETEIQNVKDALALQLKDKSLSPEEEAALRARAEAIIKAIEGQRDLDEFKESENYIKFFSEINVMSAEQAATVRGELRNAYLKAFHDGAISADELRRNLRAIDEQFKKLSESTSLFGAYLTKGVEGATEKLQEYGDTLTVLAAKMKSGKGLDAGEQDFVSRMLGNFGGKFGGEGLQGIKSFEDLMGVFSQNGGGMEAAGEALGQMGEGMSAMAAEGPGALAIVDTIIKAVNSTIVGIDQILGQLNELRAEDKQVGEWFRYVSDFNKYAFSGWEKLKSGDVIGAAVDTVSSIVSIFVNVQRDKIKQLDKAIESQQDIIHDLEYSYGRLEHAMQKAFGTDYIYNYNKQLEALQARQAAYEEQARLEEEKGKSRDKKKIEEYKNAARDTADQIADMQSQLSEFMTGTDLTSAAKEFAESWIEAYKEFGSTTDAMKEKFNDMIENMVVNSLAAQLIQGILQPIFDQIDTASRDGELSAQEIAAISEQIPSRVDMINNAMSTMMNELLASGVNLRDQASSMTGISRSIAGASEESINGLAAGINTQNFYMQHIDANVTAILATLTGGTTTAGSGTTGEYVDPYKDEMLTYVGSLPQMRDDMASIRDMLEKVIRPNGTTATHYVAARM